MPHDIASFDLNQPRACPTHARQVVPVRTRSGKMAIDDDMILTAAVHALDRAGTEVSWFSTRRAPVCKGHGLAAVPYKRPFDFFIGEPDPTLLAADLLNQPLLFSK